MKPEDLQNLATRMDSSLEVLREGTRNAIEWLVRFCELLLLAGGFSYAAHKTKDPLLGLLALLLGLSAVFYVSEYFLWVTKGWKRPQRRGWWRWVPLLAGLALVFYAIWNSSNNVAHAIAAMANSMVQL